MSEYEKLIDAQKEYILYVLDISEDEMKNDEEETILAVGILDDTKTDNLAEKFHEWFHICRARIVPPPG